MYCSLCASFEGVAGACLPRENIVSSQEPVNPLFFSLLLWQPLLPNSSPCPRADWPSYGGYHGFRGYLQVRQVSCGTWKESQHGFLFSMARDCGWLNLLLILSGRDGGVPIMS